MDALEALARRSDEGFPNLIAARKLTERRLSEMRGRLAVAEADSDACVALFGSWGRRELTAESDDDWAVLVNGPEREGVRPTPESVEAAVGEEGRKPGTQGTFGAVAFCDHLVERIGLDGDDNKNLTRRMLLLLESVGAVNEPVHVACRKRVLDGYLADSVKDYRPPRFFLNDLIRYWRTICVDFVGKEREGAGQKWALRNLKLGTSRKLLFAGGLLPILLCHRYKEADMAAFLTEWLERPSVERIALAFLELERLSRDEAQRSEPFQRGRRLGDELEQGLLALLFETRLEPLVREYGIF